MKSGMVQAFAVMGSTGEWGDRSDWLVAIHGDEKSANEHAVLAKQAAMQFIKQEGVGVYYVYGATAYDPDFKSDGGYIQYRVVPTVTVVGGMSAWVQGGRIIVHPEMAEGGRMGTGAGSASGQFVPTRVGSIDQAEGTFAEKLSRVLEVSA